MYGAHVVAQRRRRTREAGADEVDHRVHVILDLGAPGECRDEIARLVVEHLRVEAVAGAASEEALVEALTSVLSIHQRALSISARLA